jgi:hypothetical protein
VQIHPGSRPPVWGTLACVAAVGFAGVTACGASATHASTTPSPTLAESPTPSASVAPTNTPSATNPATAAISRGPKSASCVNGWVQPAPTSDFYHQATAALQESQGGTGYLIKAVRYFAGPLTSGGIGAIYYLDVRDPRLSARVVLVSGAGPSSVAVAKTGTTGWKAGDWTGFRGQQPASSQPPLPGKWSGPAYDPVSGPTPLLSTSVAGCLDGS